jgi:hypothetical protein
MNQFRNRIRKLEDQSMLRGVQSLDALLRRARDLVKHTGFRFEDAANEIVRELPAEDLERVIAEAVSRYGKDVVG